MKSGKKTRALKYFEEANKDRDWRNWHKEKLMKLIIQQSTKNES